MYRRAVACDRMERHVASPTNALVKSLVRLRDRRAREAEGAALVEGAREVRRALEGGWRPRLLVTCAELFSPEAAAADGAWRAWPADRVAFSPAAFGKVSLRQHPDGVLGLFEPPRRTLIDLPWPPAGLYLVADGLEKPGNLGALLRTADAAGADAVFVTGSGTDLLNPQVVRASMGSLFSVPTLAVEAGELRRVLADRGVRSVVTGPAADVDLWDVDLRGSVAIVVGTEHAGLADAWWEAADDRVRVPMAGAADSLNVATTGALLLFEARRQRRAHPGRADAVRSSA